MQSKQYLYRISRGMQQQHVGIPTLHSIAAVNIHVNYLEIHLCVHGHSMIAYAFHLYSGIPSLHRYSGIPSLLGHSITTRAFHHYSEHYACIPSCPGVFRTPLGCIPKHSQETTIMIGCYPPMSSSYSSYSTGAWPSAPSSIIVGTLMNF